MAVGDVVKITSGTAGERWVTVASASDTAPARVVAAGGYGFVLVATTRSSNAPVSGTVHAGDMLEFDGASMLQTTATYDARVKCFAETEPSGGYVRTCNV